MEDLAWGPEGGWGPSGAWDMRPWSGSGSGVRGHPALPLALGQLNPSGGKRLSQEFQLCVGPGLHSRQQGWGPG